MGGKFPPIPLWPPALGLGGGAKATLAGLPPYIKRGGGRGAALLDLSNPSLLSPSSTSICTGLAKPCRIFSSTTTTTPSCCWDSEEIYHSSAARWNGERKDFIDSVRATEYGSAAGLQHRNDRLHQPRDLISFRLWIFEG